MKRFTLSVFTKYLISYLIAFVIPLFVLGVIMFISFSQLLKNEIDRNSVEMLSSAQSAIDSRIQELNNTAIQIGSNPSLRIMEVSQNFVNVINTVNVLSNMALTNKFYSDIFLYYKGSELVYAASGTYRMDHFLKYIYRFEKWNTDQFIRDMDDLSDISIRPAEKLVLSGSYKQSTKYVTYIVPLPYGSREPVGAVIFLINENNFGSNLRKALNIKNGNVLILNSKGEPIISYGDTDIFYPGFVDKKVLEETTCSYRQTIQNKHCSVSSVKSNLTGWTYIVLFPINEVYSKIMPPLSKVLLGYLLAISIGFGVIYFLARTNYKPIRELASFALNAFNDPSYENANKNEIETVKTAVNKMTRVISSLQRKFETSKSGIRSSILSKLIKGYYTDLEVFKSEASEAGISFSSSSCFNIAVLIVHNDENNESSTVMGLVESYNNDCIQAYCVDGMDQNRIVVVLSFEQTYSNILGAYISDLVLILKNGNKLDITVGIGKHVSAIWTLGNSYLQASAALDYRFVKGKNTVIFYSELEDQNGDIDYYPKEKLEALGINILKADSEGVLSVLSDVFNEMKAIKLPVFYVRLLSYNIINSIFNSIYKLKGEMNLREYKYSDITSLAKLETIDELSVQIGKFCIFICSLIRQNKNGTDKSKIELMKEYIASNFSLSDFSLQMMADHFNMSVPGLSSYFKTKTGINISDYANHLKIEYAKKLLIETDESLQSIVNRIGYMNVSSFIRKFKEFTKTTPGNYRQLMKGK